MASRKDPDSGSDEKALTQGRTVILGRDSIFGRVLRRAARLPGDLLASAMFHLHARRYPSVSTCRGHTFARDDPSLYFAEDLMGSSPTIVEIGSYTGRHALALQRRYPEGRVIVYEAGRTNYGKLTQAVHGSSVKTRQEAVTGEDGVVTFHEFEGNPSSNSIVRRRDRHLDVTESYEVRSVSLEQVLRENGADRIHALFSNCEGAELEFMEEMITKPHVAARVSQMCISFHARIYGWFPVERLLRAMSAQWEIIFDADNKWPTFLFINRNVSKSDPPKPGHSGCE